MTSSSGETPTDKPVSQAWGIGRQLIEPRKSAFIELVDAVDRLDIDAVKKAIRTDPRIVVQVDDASRSILSYALARKVNILSDSVVRDTGLFLEDSARPLLVSGIFTLGVIPILASVVVAGGSKAGKSRDSRKIDRIIDAILDADQFDGTVGAPILPAITLADRDIVRKITGSDDFPVNRPIDAGLTVADDFTALGYAASLGAKRIVKFLVEKRNADVNVQSVVRVSLRVPALRSVLGVEGFQDRPFVPGSTELLSPVMLVIFAAGSVENAPKSLFPKLLAAARDIFKKGPVQSFVETAEFLLEEGAFVNGEFLLHTATDAASPAMTVLLLDKLEDGELSRPRDGDGTPVAYATARAEQLSELTSAGSGLAFEKSAKRKQLESRKTVLGNLRAILRLYGKTAGIGGEIKPRIRELLGPGDVLCDVCDEVLEAHVCDRCSQRFYCGPACQRADWRTHRPECGTKIE